MARMNQSAGRSRQAWQQRYEVRNERTRQVAAELQAAGHSVEVVEVAGQGGAGIPGGMKKLEIHQDGERLSKAQIKALQAKK